MRIPRNILDEIIKHLQSELPREGWGILAGSGEVAERVYRMTNVAESAIEYESDTEELCRVLNAIEEANMKMLCIYHSHPPVGAYFSATDLKRAWFDSWDAPAYPGVVYLVVGFRGEVDPSEWKAFRVESRHAVEEAVEIIDELADSQRRAKGEEA